MRHAPRPTHHVRHMTAPGATARGQRNVGAFVRTKPGCALLTLAAFAAAIVAAQNYGPVIDLAFGWAL